MIIIGLLAAIAVGAGTLIVKLALRNRGGDETSHLVEATALAEAVEAYRLRYGAYPPEASTTEVRRHLREFHPSLNLSTQEVETLAQLDAAEQLVFWLGGGTSNAKLQPLHDFEVFYLADIDSDGFSEMIAPDGNAYEFNGNTITVACDATDRRISVEIPGMQPRGQ